MYNGTGVGLGRIGPISLRNEVESSKARASFNYIVMSFARAYSITELIF